MSTDEDVVNATYNADTRHPNGLLFLRFAVLLDSEWVHLSTNTRFSCRMSLNFADSDLFVPNYTNPMKAGTPSLHSERVTLHLHISRSDLQGADQPKALTAPCTGSLSDTNSRQAHRKHVAIQPVRKLTG
jgi:hypothetical protein